MGERGGEASGEARAPNLFKRAPKGRAPKKKKGNKKENIYDICILNRLCIYPFLSALWLPRSGAPRGRA